MRLVSALLFVALTGSLSLADEAKPVDSQVSRPEAGRRKVPLRVVKMLPESNQVLLYDKNRGTHVVAEIGQDVDGYIVDEIDADEVTLVAPSGAEIILTGPDTSWRRRAAERKAAAGKTSGKAGAVASTEPAPVDPYADEAPAASPAASTAPSTTEAGIEAGEGGVRVASAADTGPTAAPIVDSGAPALGDPYVDPGIAAFAEAVGATPEAVTAPSPVVTAPSPAVTPAAPSTAAKADAKTDAAGTLAAAVTGVPAVAPTPSAAQSGGATAVTVTRKDIDTALADFGATAVTFDAAFTSDGLRFEHIADGTILARLGLRNGDVLTAVDKQKLRSIDDAANLYARAGTAKSATLHIVRAGKPVTLRVAIR